MAAEQAVKLADRRVCVLQTRTIPQGISAMLSFSGDADVEEFHAVLDTLGIEDAERFKVPDDWAVPVRRIPKSDVSALLTQWADITVDDLRNQDGVTYLAQYDAFYEFTSDFGPGSFIPMGGEQYGDNIRLWNGDGEGTHDELTLEVRPDGSYCIEAFRGVTT